MTFRRLLPVVICAGVAVGAGGAMAGTPTGNRQGAKLDKAVVRAMEHASIQTWTQRGWVTMESREGKSSFFTWRYGSAVIPAGSVKATERATLWLSHGRVSAWTDELTPVKCSGPKCAPNVPVYLVVNRAGHYFAFGTPSSHTCFGKLGGTTPENYGKVAYQAGGSFRKPVRQGAVTKLTYSYRLFGHAATETDAIANATSRLVSGRVVVAKTLTAPGFVIAFRYAYPRRAPKQPHIALCH